MPLCVAHDCGGAARRELDQHRSLRRGTGFHPTAPKGTNVLHNAVAFGPLVLALGLFNLAMMVLKHRRKAAWLRFEAWRKAPDGLYLAASFLNAGVWLALGASLAARLPGEPPASGAVQYWLLWGVAASLCVPLIAALSKALFTRPEEPQDWLLWDKNGAKKH
jgi:hypothetical protein